MAKLALRVGEHHVGLQTTSHEVADAARAAFADHLVDDPDVPGNVSIYAGRGGLPDARPLFRVYDGCDPWATTGRLRDALEAACGILAGFLPPSVPPPGQLEVAGVAVVGDRGAVLLPPGLRSSVARQQQLFARRGFVVAPGRTVRLDVTTGRLVPVGCTGLLDPAGRPTGPVTLRTWYVDAGRGATVGRRLVAAFGQVTGAAELPRALHEVATMLSVVRDVDGRSWAPFRLLEEDR